MAIGASRSGWVVAASIGTVEALKDQLGVCRWNYPLRSIQNRAKTSVRSYYHKHILTSSSGVSATREKMMMREKIERRGRGFKKVMDLSCWGPSTLRF